MGLSINYPLPMCHQMSGSPMPFPPFLLMSLKRAYNMKQKFVMYVCIFPCSRYIKERISNVNLNQSGRLGKIPRKITSIILGVPQSKGGENESDY